MSQVPDHNSLKRDVIEVIRSFTEKILCNCGYKTSIPRLYIYKDHIKYTNTKISVGSHNHMTVIVKVVNLMTKNIRCIESYIYPVYLYNSIGT